MTSDSATFQLWKPGPLDAVRRFILSENFQSAVQLATGILFVSLFVFVETLRFPGSCVAVLLYIVVAVTAAPDNHVGTRIFLCGFMIGPMWLAMVVGGVVATMAKLAPTPQAHMIILSTLGPLAIVPFAVNRVGTSHLFLWAMGMVSALYVGLPLLAGFAAPDVKTLWIGAVGLIFVAAFIGMFAGSVLSMIVLPSLASHKLEEDVSVALRGLGQHLSLSITQLFKQEISGGGPGPDVAGMHPLLLQMDKVAGVPVMPGVLDREAAPELRGDDVYLAVMDWFENLSRPPAAPAGGGSRTAKCLAACRTPSASDSGDGARAATFYGPNLLPGAAAAVAAAIADTADDLDAWSDAEASFSSADDSHSQQQFGNSPFSAKSHSPASFAAAAGSVGEAGPAANTGQARLRPARAISSGQQTQSLRLGSSVTAAAVASAKHHHVATQQQQQQQQQQAAFVPAASSTTGPTRVARHVPAPSIADIRQRLAHANSLLDPAAAEPQWMRGAARRFNAAAWAQVIAAAQLLAMRLSALDLLCRDHMMLLNSSHSFPMSPEMVKLVLEIYSTAAAALALLADQAADREDKSGSCRALVEVLQAPTWQQCKAELMMHVEQCLVLYWQRIEQASPEQPVTLPRGHWIRQWTFFLIVTRSNIEAINKLAAAAAAALAAPARGRAARKQQRQQRRQQQQHAASQAAAATAAGADVEAGAAAAPSPATPAAAAPPAAAAVPPAVAPWSLAASFRRHTAWVRPWLPNALNREQFANLTTAFTVELPKMFSSRAAFVRQLKGRRFIAGVKYWFVCSSVLVAVLMLLYHVPDSHRLAPNFAYSAAAVGMSDRVESTVHKVVIWTASSVLGAVLGWLLMMTPQMANNAVALAAVLCTVAFFIGSLGRSRNSLVTLYTLMTIASVVLCQFQGCCGHTGSAMMAVTRGAGVTIAAVFAVLFQNLVLPWYTSTWALEQMGAVYQQAADLLAELVLLLYLDTHALMEQQAGKNKSGGPGHDDGKEPAGNGEATAGAAAGGDVHGGVRVPSRLQQLDTAVRRVQQQQRQAQAAAGLQFADGPKLVAVDRLVAAASMQTASSLGVGPAGDGRTITRLRSLSAAAAAATQEPPDAPAADCSAAVAAAGPAFAAAASHSQAEADMLALLQHRQQQKQAQQQQQQQQQGGAGAAGAAGLALRLQAKLLRPLVHVKISLLLDTTTWQTGLYATPSVVTRMLQAMFDLVDSLGALQQAVSEPVKQLAGSWDWTLMHCGPAWASLLVEVIALADATASHLKEPSPQAAARVLQHIQEVQHKRFDFFALHRDLRRLLLVAIASDDQLRAAHAASIGASDVEGQLRYTGCVYATNKVLDRITAAARCALEQPV